VDFNFESALLIWGCNMKKKLLGTTAFLALVSGGPVLAADLPLKAPMLPAATVYSWTGFYVGGQIGIVTNSMSADPWSDPGFDGTVSLEATWPKRLPVSMRATIINSIISS
jgi:hypothetical protein